MDKPPANAPSLGPIVTYNEAWIEVFRGGAAEPFDSARADPKRFGKLFGGPGRYWVPTLVSWAESEGLAVHYVDNCWVKVAVSALQLVGFLDHLGEAREPWVEALVARVVPGDSYVIEAEEY